MPTFDQNFCLSLGDFYEKCANISMKVLRKLYKNCTIPLKSLKPKFGHFWQPAFFRDGGSMSQNLRPSLTEKVINLEYELLDS